MKKRLSPESYISGVLEGNRVILSRAITLVESTLPADHALADEVIQGILPYSGNSFRMGVTGVPGVGKSTFIESFGQLLLEDNHKVAVLAIDPSSQRTGGSILGDKTRMESLSLDKRAFIRPSPAGNTLGGVSAKTREAMLLCEAAGFDFIIVETVGVGQSETVVRDMVDFFLLLMLAGAGDELQGIKRGIIEMCDALVINKADADNAAFAKKAASAYANALHLFPPREDGWNTKVMTCSSIEKNGLEEIKELLSSFSVSMKEKGLFESRRAEQRLKWLYSHIAYLLESKFHSDSNVKKSLAEALHLVKDGKVSAIGKATEIVENYFKQLNK